MKLIWIVLMLSAIAAFAATEEGLHKQYNVQPGGRLVVDVDFGSIEVRTNATKEVVVDVWRKVSRRTKSDEEAFLKENPVIFTQDGATVTIQCRDKLKNNSGWRIGPNRNEAKYVVTVPAQFDAQVDTHGGGISVNDLSGTVAAHTSGGGLDFTGLRGPLDGNTSGGPIRIEDCEGDLKIHTSGGSINVSGGSGSLDGNTSGGPISVKNFNGPAHVKTSGGGIHVEGVTAIEGSTSGGPIEAVMSSNLSGDVKLSTSGGGVTVRLAENTAFDLDAETSGGRVSTEFPVTVVGKMKSTHLQGPVNGGGKSVWLHTSGGNIHVEKVK